MNKLPKKIGFRKSLFSLNFVILYAILAFAFIIRVNTVSFGLPSLYDPDEPLFMVIALKLLRDGSLNPAWFGHPGTTTIYTLALIQLAVFLLGWASGWFPTVHAFGEAAYANPAIVFLPGRMFIVLCGVACVLLTFLIGKRLFDKRVGLMAAAVLAANPLHVTYSQLIRTDVHATVFMLLCVLCCISIVRRGRLFDYVAAGIFAGIACATKWPAATVCACIVGACIVRCLDDPGGRNHQIRYLAGAVVVAPLALFAVSPFILIDYHQVFVDLGGEARSQHLGATGGGFLTNLTWYFAQPLQESFGWGGLALAAGGLTMICLRNRAAVGLLAVGTMAFLAAICSQGLIWSRWVVPLLPFLSLFVAVALWGIVDLLRQHFGRMPAFIGAVLISLGLLVPMYSDVRADARERLHDTRGQTSAWARANVPKGSTILVEYFAIDMIREGWQFRFPAGSIGCLDAGKAIRGQVRTESVSNWRAGRAIVDIGTIDPAKLDTCRADFAIFTDYDRYKSEQSRFGPELAVYERLLKNGVLLKTFRPKKGEIGGPIVRIVKLNPAKPFL